MSVHVSIARVRCNAKHLKKRPVRARQGESCVNSSDAGLNSEPAIRDALFRGPISS